MSRFCGCDSTNWKNVVGGANRRKDQVGGADDNKRNCKDDDCCCANKMAKLLKAIDDSLTTSTTLTVYTSNYRVVGQVKDVIGKDVLVFNEGAVIRYTSNQNLEVDVVGNPLYVSICEIHMFFAGLPLAP